MNKISPFVLFSKSFGQFGKWRSSYNQLQIINLYKINSFSINYCDNKYRANVIPIRYYSAQPKKQSTNLGDYDKTEIRCKTTNKNDITSSTNTNPALPHNEKDISKLTEITGVLTPGAPVSDKNKDKSPQEVLDELNQKPLSLFQKFKKMYKEYWYVLLPVHIVTSVVWFGSFYYVSHSGVDIPGLMETVGFGEFYIKPLRDSKLGHVAIAYLLYKVATPIRYTVTLGGTTFAIKYLVKRGYIKPVPSKNELIKKYKSRMIVRKDNNK